MMFVHLYNVREASMCENEEGQYLTTKKNKQNKVKIYQGEKSKIRTKTSGKEKRAMSCPYAKSWNRPSEWRRGNAAGTAEGSGTENGGGNGVLHPKCAYYSVDVDLSDEMNSDLRAILKGEVEGLVFKRGSKLVGGGCGSYSQKKPSFSSCSSGGRVGGYNIDAAEVAAVPTLLREFGLQFAVSAPQSSSSLNHRYNNNNNNKNTSKNEWNHGGARGCATNSPTPIASAAAVSPRSKRDDLHCTIWYAMDDHYKAVNEAAAQANKLRRDRAAEAEEQRRQAFIASMKSDASTSNALPSLGDLLSGKEDEAGAMGGGAWGSPSSSSSSPPPPLVGRWGQRQQQQQQQHFNNNASSPIAPIPTPSLTNNNNILVDATSTPALSATTTKTEATANLSAANNSGDNNSVAGTAAYVVGSSFVEAYNGRRNAYDALVGKTVLMRLNGIVFGGEGPSNAVACCDVTLLDDFTAFTTGIGNACDDEFNNNKNSKNPDEGETNSLPPPSGTICASATSGSGSEGVVEVETKKAARRSICSNAHPHLTLAFGPNAKAVYSNFLLAVEEHVVATMVSASVSSPTPPSSGDVASTTAASPFTLRAPRARQALPTGCVEEENQHHHASPPPISMLQRFGGSGARWIPFGGADVIIEGIVARH